MDSGDSDNAVLSELSTASWHLSLERRSHVQQETLWCRGTARRATSRYHTYLGHTLSSWLILSVTKQRIH